MDSNLSKSDMLRNKGVRIPNPDSVEIGDDVDLDRISGEGVVIYPGCRIYGQSTLVMEGVKLGCEGPVTLDACQVGPDVQLKGGYFNAAVFLEKSSAGSGAHVRRGSILEEEANIAHTVGLKQTILFPFVTLGSLINFCDCFMAGGTSRKDHSEVGSSYIHFNFTPNQDKATASLIGDVPAGVMLDQPPIFLGGQGGLVGPCRIAYGTTIAAGTIYRKDELRPGRLLIEKTGRGGSVPFATGIYRSVKRIIINNINYLGNLFALMQWYCHVRPLFISKRFSHPLLDALVHNLNLAIDERIHRLEAFSEKMPASIQRYRESIEDDPSSTVLTQKKEIHRQWPQVKGVLEENLGENYDSQLKHAFLESLHNEIEQKGCDYIKTIQSLDPHIKAMGNTWLQGIVDKTNHEVMALLPSLQ